MLPGGVIPKLGAVQPSEESGAECFTVLSPATWGTRWGIKAADKSVRPTQVV